MTREPKNNFIAKKVIREIKRDKNTQKVFLNPKEKSLNSTYNTLSQESVIIKSTLAFFYNFLSDIARHFAIMIKLHGVSPTPLGS
ncbi:hypothetical protein ECE48_03640 [Helicobacter pylori]|nr:hypothetical protein ECE48_03640 [Helicobacter pylori]